MQEGYEYWDIGSDTIVHPSEKVLGKLMVALVALKGKIHDYSTLTGGFPQDKMRYWTIGIRISLPKGARKQFEERTGLQLTPPPKVSVGETISTRYYEIQKEPDLRPEQILPDVKIREQPKPPEVFTTYSDGNEILRIERDG